MEAERNILDFIRAGKLELPPLSFTPIFEPTNRSDVEPDILVQTKWQGKKYTFVAEVKRYGSDKSVDDAVRQVRFYAEKLQLNPLIIVPWLSTEQLLWLEQSSISGVDLCGNGVIVVPGEMLVFKSGQPNKFPASRLIRRVYEGTSSLVARVFLLQPQYDSVSAVLSEIRGRGGMITLSTVSKALKQLEEDVVIEKSSKQIRLLQADKLLDRLKADYEPPKFDEIVRCKMAPKGKASIGSTLQKAAKQAGVRLVLSGESSVNYYATMAKEPVDVFYCSEIRQLNLEKMVSAIDYSSRFPNVELRKSSSEMLFFDMRDSDSSNSASPIQAYLELAISDKRGQETAEQIRQKIISDLKQTSRKRLK